MTRPAGDCHMALLRAAMALKIERAQTGQGATLLELVQRSQVGYAVARRTIDNMYRNGHLAKVGERRVDYRNRPVYEYAPGVPDMPTTTLGSARLGAALSGWNR